MLSVYLSVRPMPKCSWSCSNTKEKREEEENHIGQFQQNGDSGKVHIVEAEDGTKDVRWKSFGYSRCWVRVVRGKVTR